MEMPDFGDPNAWIASLIPAALGAAVGKGQRGTMAAAGMGAGMGAQLESKQTYDKLNADIAYRNQLNEQAQQRTNIERQQLEAQQQHWAALERHADTQSTFIAAQTKRLDAESADYQKTIEGHDRFAQDQLGEKEAGAFNALDMKGKAKYIDEWNDRRVEDAKRPGMIQTLKGLGFPNAEAYGRSASIKDAADLIKDIMHQRAQSARDNKPHFTGAIGPDGKFYSMNSQTGQWSAAPELRAVKPEDRIQWRKQALAEWKAQNPLALNPEDGFSEWLNSPRGRLEESFSLRRITPEEYEAKNNYLERDDASRNEDALAEMRRSMYDAVESNTGWLGANPFSSRRFYRAEPTEIENKFQTYLKTPPGQENFKKWREEIDRRRSRTPEPVARPVTAAPPAAAPKEKEKPKPPKQDLMDDFKLK